MAKNIMYQEIPFELTKDEDGREISTTPCPYGFPNEEKLFFVGSWHCRYGCPYSLDFLIKENFVHCTHPLDE